MGLLAPHPGNFSLRIASPAVLSGAVGINFYAALRKAMQTEHANCGDYIAGKRARPFDWSRPIVLTGLAQLLPFTLSIKSIQLRETHAIWQERDRWASKGISQ